MLCMQNACRKDQVMATLTVRNLDDDVLDSLKARARAHERSLEAEVREILRREARHDGRRLSVDELLRLADKVAAMTPPVQQTDSVELLREAREMRSR